MGTSFAGVSVDTALYMQSFDDLCVGDAFTTSSRTLTESDAVCFAALSGSWLARHADGMSTPAGLLSERIANGMLVLSYAARLVPLDVEGIVGLHRVSHADFRRPVRLGDRIHVEGQVEYLEEVDDRLGIASCRWTIVNQNRSAVAEASVEVLWRRSGEQELLLVEPGWDDDPVLP